MTLIRETTPRPTARPGAAAAHRPAPAPAPVQAPAMSGTRRGVQLILGLLGFAASMAMLLHAGQGGMPWDVLHQGVVRSTGLGFGWVVAITSALVLLAWIPLRQRPGLGTVMNVVVISVTIGPFLGVMDAVAPEPGVATSIVLVLAGVIVNGIATAAYIGVRLGPGPRDGLMTGLVARTGWSVRLVRTGVEVVVVLAGVLLGGTFGWATIAYAFGVGPVVQAATRWRRLVPAGLVDTPGPAGRSPAPAPATAPGGTAGGRTDADLARRAEQIARAMDAIRRAHPDT
ncbi:hypothetical protein LEP48_16950 [Isoptericola sp. NEAU-Y5]|uniref:Integral membrane protein n=1 Tax=Isoptericola luteus TaxID=2879484 RepID=A0ABS7ZJ13_9MICO|nr:hypothetical protein [Isoptericola sp. NEAU-Y5]MCA5895020.1 hypothetical protein [Isoptericola sp. NEAU-Y5]